MSLKARSSHVATFVQFSRALIDCQGIHMDPAKIESIKDWVSPKTPIEISQFLGLARYYQRFIKGFSKIAKPMTKLTQKKVAFEWGDKQEAAFQTLKNKMGAMLSKTRRLIAYAFTTVEDSLRRNYTTHIWNLVTVVFAPKEFGGLDLPKQILNAQTEAQKPENLKNEDVGDSDHARVPYKSKYSIHPGSEQDVPGHEKAILVAQYEGRHRHLC
ncbi:hypothetical protein Tco_0337430 [Tanacetum coccineum]